MNKTEKKILDAAFDILAQDLSAPLDKVAEAAGVTRNTLHRYFNSRDALLEATGLEMIRLSNQIIDEAVAKTDSADEQLKEIVMKASQMGERFHFLMHASEEMDQEAIGPLIQQLDMRMVKIIEALREQGLIQKDVPNAWILHFYGGVLTAAWSSLREGAVAPRDIPLLTWKTFTQGIFGDA
ncbi:MAG: TetR/AcrR family transcriptional regulator [Chloroflexota bacterium]